MAKIVKPIEFKTAIELNQDEVVILLALLDGVINNDEAILYFKTKLDIENAEDALDELFSTLDSELYDGADDVHRHFCSAPSLNVTPYGDDA